MEAAPAAVYGMMLLINARDASACASTFAARNAPPPLPRGIVPSFLGTLRQPNTKFDIIIYSQD